MSSRVAIVTGSNKGIGFAIVKGLAASFKGTVYLTARNNDLGNAAVEELKKLNLNVSYHQLDIDNEQSIKTFAEYIKTTHGGIDVLINNAAIAFKAADPSPFSVQATETIRINYTGTLNLCNALFPLLRANARVVNVSSRAGLLKIVKTDELKQKFIAPDATADSISALLKTFVDAAQENKHESLGYPSSAYGMSKVGLTSLSMIQHRELSADASRPGIIVQAMCPGYVNTDMSSHKGHLTPEQGADTALFLSELPADAKLPAGGFWAERKPFDWITAQSMF